MPERGRHTKRGEQRTPAGGSNAAGDAVVLDHGTLGARVARCAVADTFDAIHPPTGTPRLVHVLRPAASKDQPLVHRVVCEADAASWLRDPTSAKVHGYGNTPDGRMYVAVERPAGRPLGELLAEGGPLPAARVVRMACHLVAALAEAHAVGLVHGDLAPSSVVLAEDADVAGGWRVTLAGLGLTWLAVARDVRAEDRPFLSPERLAGAEPDVRSDVYGLAALLQHALGDAAVTPAAAEVLAIARSTEPARRQPGVRELWEDLLAALVGGAATVRAEVPVSREVAVEPAIAVPALDLDAIALEIEIVPIPPPPRALSADVAAVAASGWVAVAGPSSALGPWLGGADLWAPVTAPGETTGGWSAARPADAYDLRDEPPRRPRPHRMPPSLAAPPPRRRRSVVRVVLWLALPAAAAALAWSRVGDAAVPEPPPSASMEFESGLD